MIELWVWQTVGGIPRVFLYHNFEDAQFACFSKFANCTTFIQEDNFMGEV